MIRSDEKFSFHLSPSDHAIVEAIRKALEDEMPDIMSDHGLLERNGYGQFRWNVIISQLREMCSCLGWLELNVVPRGAWKTPVLYDGKSRFLITFMTETTFRTVQKRIDKGTHYLCGAASFNENLKPKYEQLELALPGISPDSEQWVAKSQEQLMNAVQAKVGEILGHILVLFEAQGDKLLSVRAVRLTHELAISTEEEDWSSFIRVPFDAHREVDTQHSEEKESDILVELL